jgi:hypothetical protein
MKIVNNKIEIDIDELNAEMINKLINFFQIPTDGISDGWHSFEELYEFRKMYNAALFNTLAVDEYDYFVHKSWKHYDGEYCFEKEKKWFIVSALLPTGLISNHYKAKDWELFKIREVDKALFEFDGHTPKDVLERLKSL